MPVSVIGLIYGRLMRSYPTNLIACIVHSNIYLWRWGKLSQLEKRAKRRAIRQLHDAVNKNDVALVEELINPELDVDFHYSGQTALQIAVLNGFEDVCRILINSGADVDKANAESNNLLNMATWRGYSDIVKLLVSRGAELNMSNNHGSTSLNTAAFKGYPTITQILIDGGAFINKPNLNQQTPLLVSCKQGHYPVAKLLIEGGCDLDWADTERKTPLIAAADRGHSRIVQLLVDAGLSTIHPLIIFGLSKERPILGDHPKAHIHEIWRISREIRQISCEIHLQNF